jgi:hypothetical protein
VWRDTKPKEREMEQDSQDRDMESWYKVTVSILERSALVEYSEI